MITRITWIIGLFVTTVMVLLYAIEPRPLIQARATVQDTYQRAAPREPDRDAPVHVVDIDERSLKELGQWPWPRTYLAELTERLFDLGAATIGFDILFSEADRTSPAAILENWVRFTEGSTLELGDLSGLPEHDRRFADALAMGPTVLAVAGATSGASPEAKAGIAYTGRLPEKALSAFKGALSPIEVLSDAAAGLGGISLVSGSDGITRSVPMLALYGDETLPSFSAELLRVAQGAGGHILRTSEASGQISGGQAVPVEMRTGALSYPLDERGHFRIHFNEGLGDRTTSAADILSDDADFDALRARLEGKIVIVGSSAQALFDIRATPLTSELPGVHLHATIIDQIISGDFLVRPDWTRGLELVLIVAVGLFVTALAARERPVPGLMAAIVSVGALLLGGWIAFRSFGLILNPFEPAVTALAVYLPATTLNVFGKDRARRRIRERFGYFLPTAIVDEIAADPEESLTPSGAEKILSVMFVDMRRFSTLSENMDPTDVVRLLNIYLGAVTEALVESGATIDKFMGDGIMAFWNAPIAREDHAGACVAAIFRIEAAVAHANTVLASEGLPRIEARIGANTGPAFVGLMGSSERLNYSCVGDSVTLAARFEALTRMYGVGNLVGEQTAREIPAECIAVDIDRVVVKGRQAAATVASVLRRDENSELLAQRVREMRTAYLRGQWSDAREMCRLLSEMPGGAIDTQRLASVYLDRIDKLEALRIPQNWDGNFEALRLA